jgi:hypothetical protein
MRASRREPREPREPKGKGFWAALMVACVLLVLLGYVVLWPNDTQLNVQAVPAAPSTPSATATLTPTPGTAVNPATTPCPEQAKPEGDPDMYSPPVVNWSLLDTMAVPHSDATGPWSTASGFRTCYHRSSGGALVSVANFIGELAATPIENRAALVQARVAREQGYEDLLRRVTEQASRMTYDLPAGEGPNAQDRLQITGYRWIDYTPDRTTVEIVYRITATDKAGLMSSGTYRLVWADNDWKIVVPPTGQTMFTPVESLTGYVQWGGA